MFVVLLKTVKQKDHDSSGLFAQTSCELQLTGRVVVTSESVWTAESWCD